MRYPFIALVLCAAIATPYALQDDSAHPSSLARAEQASAESLPTARDAALDGAVQRAAVSVAVESDPLISPEVPRPIDALPTELSDRVAYIYRRFYDAYESREWQLPPNNPQISVLDAEALRDRYAEYWSQYEEANEHYERRLVEVLENGGEFTGALASADTVLPDFESLARAQLGDRYLGAEGHTIAVNDGSTWKWGYFPPGADLEVDELCAWCDSFEHAAPDVYRGWLHDYFTF